MTQNFKFDLQRFATTWRLSQETSTDYTVSPIYKERKYILRDGTNSYSVSENNTDKNYADISGLINEHTSAGDTIIIRDDLEISQSIAIEHELTFEIDGSLNATKSSRGADFKGNDLIHVQPYYARIYNVPTLTIKGEGTLNTNGLADRAITIHAWDRPIQYYQGRPVVCATTGMTLNLDGVTINSSTNGIYSDWSWNDINLTNGAQINLNNSDGYAIFGDVGTTLNMSGSSIISGNYKNAVNTTTGSYSTHVNMSEFSKITGTATGNVIETPSKSTLNMSGNSAIDVKLSVDNTDLAIINADNATITLNDNAKINANITNVTSSTSATISGISATNSSKITLNGSSNSINIASEGLKDTSAKAYAINLDDSTLDLKAGTVSNSSSDAFRNNSDDLKNIAAVLAGNKSTVNVAEGANITLPQGSGLGIYSHTGGNTLNISGNVDGKKVSDNQSVGIYLDDANGTVNIKDGATVSGSASGVEVKAGTLNVTGGTVQTYANSWNDYYGNETVTSGTAISVTPNNADSKVDVNFSGGTTSGYVAIGVYNPDNVSSSNIAVDVTDGTIGSTSAPIINTNSNLTVNVSGNPTFLRGYEAKSETEKIKITGGTFNLNGTGVLVSDDVAYTNGDTWIRSSGKQSATLTVTPNGATLSNVSNSQSFIFEDNSGSYYLFVGTNDKYLIKNVDGKSFIHDEGDGELVKSSYTIGKGSYVPLIAADKAFSLGSVTDYKDNDGTIAYVVDYIDFKHLNAIYAAVTYSDSTYNLYAYNSDTDTAANNIPYINLTTDTTKVKADFATHFLGTGDGSTTYTLDGSAYKFNSGNFIVKATAAGATSLYQGNITLADISKPLSISNGKTVQYGYHSSDGITDGVVVNVSGGEVTSITDLELGEYVIYDGKTYSIDKEGILTIDGVQYSKINGESITAETNILGTPTSLVSYVDASNGIFNIEAGRVLLTGNEEDEVYYRNGDTDYAILTKSGSTYTLQKLAQASGLSSHKILLSTNASTINILDFGANTTATATTGNYTVNNAKYNVTNAATLNVVTNTQTNLKSGSVSLNNASVSTADGNTVTATSGTVTVTVSESDGLVIDYLWNGKAFKINGTNYVYDNVGLHDSNNTYYYNEKSDRFYYNKARAVGLLEPSNGVVSISDATKDYFIVDSASNPTAKYATAHVYSSDTGASFIFGSSDSGASNIKTINFAGSTLLILNLETNIVTNSTAGTYTVNNVSYTSTGASALTIAVTSSSAPTLTSGTVSLAKDEKVTLTSGNVITAKSGRVTVTTDGTNISIGDLQSGDIFTVDGTIYQMTSAGVVNDGKLYLLSNNQFALDSVGYEMYSEGSIVLDKKNLYFVDSTSAPTKVYAVVTYDATAGYSLTRGKDYTSGKITSTYMESDTTILNLNLLDTIVLPAVNKTFTINGAEFTPTGSSRVSIHHFGSTLRFVDGEIYLTNSTLDLYDNRNTVKVTGGTVTLSGSRGNISSITGLDEDETVTYAANTYKNLGDGFITKNDTKIFIDGSSDTNLVALSDNDAFNYLQTSGNTLTLTSGRYIYGPDATFNKSTFSGLSTSNDGAYSAFVDSAVTIDATTLSDLKSLSTTAGYVNTPSTTSVYTINNSPYNANGQLTLKIDSSNFESSLYAGSVALDSSTYVSVTDSDKKVVTVQSGDGINVVAAGGALTSITSINSGDSFTINDGTTTTTYTTTTAGLVSSGKLYELTDGTFTLGSEGITMIAPSNNELDLSNVTAGTYAVVDSLTSPTKRLATVNFDSNGYTITGGTDAATSIQSVNIASPATVTVDFATNILTGTSGAYKVNGNSYTSTSALEIKTTANSSTLTNGTISLAENSIVTTTGNNTLESVSGTASIKVYTDDNGAETVTLNNIASGISVKYNSVQYDGSAIGLVSGGRVYTENTSYIFGSATGTKLLASSGGSLDLTNIDISESNFIIADSTTDPTTKYATATYDRSAQKFDIAKVADGITAINLGADVTTFNTDFAVTTTSSTKANYTINGTTYNMADSTALEVAATDKTSTFTAGKIIYADTDTALQITGGKELSYYYLGTASDGVVVTAAGGTVSSITDLEAGEMVEYDGKVYYRAGSKVLTVIDTATLAEAQYQKIDGADVSDTSNILGTLSDGLGNVLVKDSVFYLNSGASLLTGNTTSVDYVDETSNDVLATLTRSGNTYTLTRSSTGTVSNAIMQNRGLADVQITGFDSATTMRLYGTNAYKVNGQNYSTKDNSIIAVTDNNTTTFTSGSIALNTSTYNTVTLTNGKVLNVTGGNGITLTVSSDKTVVSDLSTGDTFTYDGKSYEMTAIGVKDTSNTYYADDDNSPTSLNLSNLQTFTLIAPSSGAVNLTSSRVYVVDNTSNPTVRYAIWDGENLTSTTSTASTNITSVNLDSSIKTMTANFATNVVTNSASGTYKVNGVSYNSTGASALTIATTATSSTLTGGTVSLAENANVTLTGGQVITATSGSVTVTKSGDNVTVGELASGDVFTVNDGTNTTTYTTTAAGLVNGDGNLYIPTNNSYTLGTAGYVMYSSGKVNLASENAVVVDSLVAPTKIYATITYDGTACTVKGGTSTDNITSITLDDKTTSLTADFAATIITPATAATYTINSKEYNSTGAGALTVKTTSTSSTLYDGVVNVTGNLNDVITVTGGNGVTVTVAEGAITSITGLDVGETLTYNGNTYIINSANEIVVDGKTIYKDQSSDTNISNLTGGIGYTQITNAIDIGSDTAQFYGTSSTYDSSTYFAELTTSGSAYTLTKRSGASDISDLTITASSDVATVNAYFAATLTTAELASGNTFTANGVTYTAASEGALTFKTTSTSSTLYNGVVNVTDSLNDDAVKVTGGSVDVTVANGAVTSITGLDAGETVTYDGKTYVKNSLNELVVDGTTIYRGLSSTQNILDLSDATAYTYKQITDTINITSTDNNILYGTGSTYDATTYFGELQVDSGVYTISKNSNASDISGLKITAGSGISTVAAHFDATLTSPTLASGDTFTANGVTYTAASAETLTITMTSGGATLYNGVVTVSDSLNGLVTVTSGKVDVTVTNGTITSITGLDAGETVTYGGNTYIINSANEIVVDGNTIYKDQSSDTNILSLTDGIGYTQITNAIDIGSDTAQFYGTTTTYSNTTYFAELTTSGGAQTLTKRSGASAINNFRIFVGDGANLTTNFSATVYTPATAGTYTINGKEYVSTGTNDAFFIIAATATSSTLTSGTVTLNQNSSVTLTSGETITATTGSIYVKTDGTNITIQNLDSGDAFTIGNTTYTMAGAGLVSGGKLYPADGGTFTVGSVGADMIAPSEGTLSLVQENAVVVDSTSAPTTKYAVLVYDSTTKTSTLSSETSSAATAITTVSLGTNNSILNVDFATKVTASTQADYTINGTTYKMSDSTALEVAAKANSSTFTAGKITFADTTNALQLTGGNELNYAYLGTASDGVVVTATGGSATSITDLEVGEIVEYADKLYYRNGDKVLTIIENNAGKQYRKVDGADISNTSNILGTPSEEFNVVYVENNTFDLKVGASLITGGAYSVEYRNSSDVTLATLTQTDSTYTLTRSTTGTVSNAIIQNYRIAEVQVTGFDASTTMRLYGTNAYKVNGDGYSTTTKADSVIAVTNASTTTLTSGTVALDTTTYKAVTTTDGQTITATAGDGINVNVSGSTVTISNLTNGDKFTVGSDTYTMTTAGLIGNGNFYTSESSYILGTSGTAMIAISSSGALTLAKQNALIVDSITAPTIHYANLSYSATSGYTINGVNQAATIKTINLTDTTPLTVDFVTTVATTGENKFTINSKTYDAKTALTIAATSGSSTLTSGTVALAVNGNVTLTSGEVVTATSGSVTVTKSGTNITVGELASGDAFTVDNTTYTMTAAGLVSAGRVYTENTSYVIGSATGTKLLATSGGALDLTSFDTGESTFIIADSVTTPTTKYATATYNSDTKTFTATNIADGINTITLGTNATTLKADFAATVNVSAANSGTYTINGNAYKMADSTALEVAMTADSSTLTSGTVELDTTTYKAVTTTDGQTITATAGDGISVNVSGSTVTIGGLASGDKFTVDSDTYTMTTAGLIGGGKIYELADDTFTLGSAGTTMLAVSEGALDLTSFDTGDSDVVIVDSITAPTTKYATATYSSSTKTFTATNITEGINTITLGTDATTLKADFAATVNVSAANSGTYTINGNAYKMVDSTALVVAMTADSSTLTSGTIALEQNETVTLTNERVITATSGSITVKTDGTTITIGELTSGDAFTVDDTSYTMTTRGLVSSGKLYELTDGTFTLGSDGITMLVPANNTLDLSTIAEGTYAVFDSVTNPTKSLATVKYDSSGYTITGETDAATAIQSVNIAAPATVTVDFVTNILTGTSGAYTVNGNSYTATSALEIKTTANSSTLTSGTVSLAENAKVTLTSGEVITATSGSVTVTKSGDNVTVRELASGDAFTVDSTTYTMTAAGLVSGGRVYTENNSYVIGSSTGTKLLTTSGGELDLTNIDTDESNFVIVDNISAPTSKYATATYDSGTKTFTATKVAGGIGSIILGTDTTTLKADFAVTAKSDTPANYTINGTTYKMADSTALEIAATADGSTFTAGKIIFADIDNDLQITGGKELAYFYSGTASDGVVVTATSGVVSSITDLEVYEVVTYAGKLYSRSDPIILTVIDSNNDYAITQYLKVDGEYVDDTSNILGTLSETLEYVYITEDGVLNLNTGVSMLTPNNAIAYSTVAYDDSNSYAELTKNGDQYILTKNPFSTQTVNNPIVSNAGIANVQIDNFPTNTIMRTGANNLGAYTVNGSTYNTKDSVDILISGESSTSLSNGTVALDTTTYTAVTTTDGQTITATAGDGINVNVSGSTVTISELNTGDAFTAGSDTYIMTEGGLIGNGKFYTSESSYILGTSGTTMIELVDGAFTLEKQNTVIVNDITSPTIVYANLTYDETEGYTLEGKDNATEIQKINLTDATPLTVDFETTVATTGEVEFTINGSAYNAKDNLTVAIAEDGSSMLVDGTVNVKDTLTTSGGEIYISDPDGADVKVESGKITAVTELQGTATSDFADGISVNSQSVQVKDGDNSVVVSATNNSGVSSISEVDANATISATGGASAVNTTGDGKFNFANQTYEITGDGDGVTFAPNTSGTVENISAVDTNSTLTATGAEFTLNNGEKINNYNSSGKNVITYSTTFSEWYSGAIPQLENVKDYQLTVNSDLTLSLTADGEAVTNPVYFAEVLENPSTNYSSGLTINSALDNGKKLSIVNDSTRTISINAASGREITLETGNKAYTINGATITPSGSLEITATTDGATFVPSSAVEFSGSTLSGDGSAIVYNNGTAQVVGTVKFDSKTVTTLDTVPVDLAPRDGQLELTSLEISGDDSYSVRTLEGDVLVISDIAGATIKIPTQSETYYCIVNNQSLTLDKNTDTVTLNVDADGHIQSVENLTGSIEGLSGDVTVNAVSSDVTINNKEISINEGTTTAFDVIIADSMVTTITGVDSGANITKAPNVSLVTSNAGNFTIDGTGYSVTGSNAIFGTNANTNVTDVVSTSQMTIQSGNPEYRINGNEIKISASNENVERVQIGTNGTSITNISGLQTGDTLDGDIDATEIQFPGTGDIDVSDSVVLTLSDVNYTLTADSDGITKRDVVFNGLAPLGVLEIDRAGIYTVNGTILLAFQGDRIIGKTNGGAYVASPTDITVSSQSDIEDIVKNLAQSPNNIEVLADTSSSDLDLTSTTKAQRVHLTEDIDQTVKLNNYDGNIVVVETGVEGTKNINTGDGNGNLVVVMDDAGPVSVKAGNGNGYVMSKSANTTVDVDGASGHTKLLAFTDKGEIQVKGYDAEKANAEIQTRFDDIPTAVMQGNIKIQDGVVNVGDSKIILDENADTSGTTEANIYTQQREKQKTVATNSDGGTINKSASKESILAVGNLDGQKGASNITTGSGNDIIFGGSGDVIDAGTGNNAVFLNQTENYSDVGAEVKLSGRTTIFDFDSTKDRINADLNDTSLEFKFDGDNLRIKNSDSIIDILFPDTFGGATSADAAENYMSSSNYTKLLIGSDNNSVRAAITSENGNIAVEETSDEMVTAYVGENSGVNMENYSGDVLVNLNENQGTFDNNNVYFKGIQNLKAGSGTATLMGSANAKNVLMAGSGNDSMWGGGSEMDTLIGNSEQNASTEFFFMDGDGRDQIHNFQFSTADNRATADKLNFDTSVVREIKVSGNDLIISMNNGENDILTLKDAAGKDVHAQNSYIEVTAQIADTLLTYDGVANYYEATGKNATVEVSSDVYSAEIWLNNPAQFYGNIKEVNASNMEGNVIIAGNDENNILRGSKGNSSLWGAGGNDSLVGGSGSNVFWYGFAEGNDTISNANSGDTINLYNISLEQIKSAELTGRMAKFTFTNDETLTVNSSSLEELNFQLADKSTWKANISSKTFTQK